MSEKTNEIPVAKAVLPLLPAAGRVFTSDARPTHADFMQITHDQRGASVYTVKQNQPTLYANLATSFADPYAVCQQAETWDRRRGRVEHRVIRVSTEMNAYLAPDWPLVAQVAQVTRTVTKKGDTSTEVVSLMTDLSCKQAPPLRLLSLVRGHWGIGAIRFAETSESSGMASKEVKSSLTTERVMWGAIPHPLGERGNAAPSR